MDAVALVLVIAHFLGLAAIIGGAAERLRARVNLTSPVTLWGARAQLLTGLALAGLAFSGADDEDGDSAPSHIKIALKLVIALAVVAIAEMNAKKAKIAFASALIVGLAAVNVIIAVAW